MFSRKSNSARVLIALMVGSLNFTSAGQLYAADSHLAPLSYPVKAGVKKGDYEYSVPVRSDGSPAPIVEVHPSNERYEFIVRDKDIHFTTEFRVECGKGWRISGDGLPVILDGKGKTITSSNKIDRANSRYNYIDSVMEEFVPPSAKSPQTACNDVIDQRRAVGQSVGSFLKDGFWIKIKEAYPIRLTYGCEKKPKIGFKDIRSNQLESWQPLFVHCLGDPDYGKQTAKTSKNTSTSSASHADIKRALDEKQAKKEAAKAGQPNRANPLIPTSSSSNRLRYRALLSEGNIKRSVSSPKTLDDFLDYGNKLSAKRGMRLVDFEVVPQNSKTYYVGLWEKGSGTNLFHKPVSIKKFNKLHADYREQGLRLADFELLHKQGKTRIVSFWKSGAPNQEFSLKMSVQEFKKHNAAYKEKGMYPSDIEVYVSSGKIRYAALWREYGADESARDFAPSQFMPAIEASEFRATRDQLIERNQRPLDIERVAKNGKVYFSGLWVEGRGLGTISKPRDLENFKQFARSLTNSYIDDLEVHPNAK